MIPPLPEVITLHRWPCASIGQSEVIPQPSGAYRFRRPPAEITGAHTHIYIHTHTRLHTCAHMNASMCKQCFARVVIFGMSPPRGSCKAAWFLFATSQIYVPANATVDPSTEVAAELFTCDPTVHAMNESGCSSTLTATGQRPM